MDKLPNKELRSLLTLAQNMVNSRSLSGLPPVVPGPFPSGQNIPLPPGQIGDIGGAPFHSSDRLSTLNTLGQCAYSLLPRLFLVYSSL